MLFGYGPWPIGRLKWGPGEREVQKHPRPAGPEAFEHVVDLVE